MKNSNIKVIVCKCPSQIATLIKKFTKVAGKTYSSFILDCVIEKLEKVCPMEYKKAKAEMDLYIKKSIELELVEDGEETTEEGEDGEKEGTDESESESEDEYKAEDEDEDEDED